MSASEYDPASAADQKIRTQKRPPRVVRCTCGKCLRQFDHVHIHGMRRWPDGTFLAVCYSCLLIGGQVRRRSGRDLPGQLLLPLYPCQG